MRLHPFCTLNKAIRRFTWEFWKKLVWCKFWRSWEQNAEKGSFIDMDVYNKYTIYEVYKLFLKKKKMSQFCQEATFYFNKDDAPLIFFAKAFCYTRNPLGLLNNPWSTSKVPKSYSHQTKEDSTTNLTGENGKNTMIGKKTPRNDKSSALEK